MENENKNRESLIVLKESGDARAFDEKNLINYREFIRAKEWISKQAKDAALVLDTNYSDSCDEFIPKYNTISILGTRGSGKTSFMKSLLNLEWADERIQTLGVLDPTLIEEKGHPFLTIIAEINSLVISRLEKEDVCVSSCRKVCRQQWDEQLKSLAEGLPTLDTMEPSYEKWQDADYIMKLGLKRVKGARDLARNFHGLLKCALKILDKKAFLIALDDIDVDFLKGWPVLETLRKYLTTPLIITLLSGDFDLYSMAIRKQQWKNFGRPLLVNEGEKLDRLTPFDNLVTQMEGQYIQKVLSPNNRIYLKTLLEKKFEGKGYVDINIDARSSNSHESINIEDAYKEQLKVLGIVNPLEREVYVNFLLGLPIRTQIRLLTALYSDTENRVEAWTDVFLSELYVLEADIDLIRSNPGYTTMVMLRFLQEQKLLSRAYKFQPTLQESNINAVLFALTATYSIYSANYPYLFFDYFIRIGLPLALSDNGVFSSLNSDKPNDDFDAFNAFVDFAKLVQERGLSKCCGDIIAFLQGAVKGGVATLEDYGVLDLRGFAGKAKQGVGGQIGRIDSQLRGSSILKRTIGYLPVTVVTSSWKQSTIVCASFHRLLATIGELLKYVWTSQLQNINNLYSILKSAGIRRTYTMPLLGRLGAEFNSNPQDILDNEDEQYSVEFEKEDKVFLEVLLSWVKNVPEDMPFSPNLVGRILSRLQRGIALISRTSEINLGDYMHRCIILFLNAVLVETCTEKESSLPNGLSLNNVISDDNKFIANLNKVQQENEHALPTLASWLLGCPLLLVFLKPISEMQTAKDSSNDTNKYLFNAMLSINGYSVYDELSNVHISKKQIDVTSMEKMRENAGLLYERLSSYSIDELEEEILSSVANFGKNGKSSRLAWYKRYHLTREKGATHEKALEEAKASSKKIVATNVFPTLHR